MVSCLSTERRRLVFKSGGFHRLRKNAKKDSLQGLNSLGCGRFLRGASVVQLRDAHFRSIQGVSESAQDFFVLILVSYSRIAGGETVRVEREGIE